MATEKRLDLIDRKKLFNDLADYWGIPRDWDGQIDKLCEDALCAIENAPEVEAVEVVHGRWIKRQFADDMTTAYRCSECHTTWDADTNYCPNCGAKMDGDLDAER